jgi:hypothetical protein
MSHGEDLHISTDPLKQPLNHNTMKAEEILDKNATDTAPPHWVTKKCALTSIEQYSRPLISALKQIEQKSRYNANHDDMLYSIKTINEIAKDILQKFNP